MKKRILQLMETAKFVMIMLLIGLVGKMYAYDFSAVCSTGQTLYYNITDASNHYVELTSPYYNSGWSGYTKPTGEIVLPKTVRHNGVNYSVTSIGSHAFNLCNGLTGSLVIPNSVTNIGYMAFSGCTGFTGSLSIPNSVISIDSWAFENCSGFTGTLIIPSSVTSIRGSAFRNCSGIEAILVDAGNPIYDSRGNCNAIINTSTNELVLGCKNTIIPNNVSSIGPYAFAGCSGLIGCLTIPNSVTSIGGCAFLECIGLTGNLSIPNSVTILDYGAFSGCIGLTSISIPNSVNTISFSVFNGCVGLTSILIPNSVTSIGNWVLNGCDELQQIVVESNNPVYDSRDNSNAIIETSTNTLIAGCKNSIIPNSITSIGYCAFTNCSGLTSVIIPNSVITIDNFAFENCSGLISVAIGNSVTRIGECAFRGCSGLFSSLTIPNSVTIIDNDAFSDCGGLTEVLMLGTNPPSLGSRVFSNFFIYVPHESLNTYKTAANWSNYTNWIFPMTYTTISAHGESDGWRFIASPLADSIAPTVVDNMITESNFDLYRFDQTENAEWRNYKANNFNLVNGQGYLYTNAEDVNLIFKGTFNEDETKNVGLIYDANASFAGWNLVGNPFPCNAYANKSYYTMNEDGSAIEPVAVSMETAIPACTGVMVKAENTGESVTFSKTAPETAVNQGVLQIALSQMNPELVEGSKGGVSTGSTTALDKAIVSFNAGDALEKFVFNKDNAKLYIPQSDKDLAIACTDKQGEMPLNFKVAKNGEYTITIHPEVVELDYLHLVDNLTGVDVDLLVTPAYTFTAKTTDYASRFKLVFSVCGDMDDDNENFAFVTNKDIIITGEGIAQVIDMRGRVIVSVDEGTRCISTVGMTQGVYVLRLLDRNDVKTQKIVIQ